MPAIDRPLSDGRTDGPAAGMGSLNSIDSSDIARLKSGQIEFAYCIDRARGCVCVCVERAKSADECRQATSKSSCRNSILEVDNELGRCADFGGAHTHTHYP